ncbi:MAG: hypothetical protein FWH57_00960 [Oscillospiraceae bacterium]|nr:hypothetical protein [Oscillospiraceae bacterium]
MKNGGIGVGSASLVLVFAVLCLTVFSLITFVVAGNDKALTDAEAKLVAGYYEADAFAENIVAEIVGDDDIPDSVGGIDITYEQDFSTGEKIASFVCPISSRKELYVSVALSGESYDILSWRMFDIGQWAVDDKLNVWQGPDESETGDPTDVLSKLKVD